MTRYDGRMTDDERADDLTPDEVALVRRLVGMDAPQPRNWNGPCDSPYEATLTKVLAGVTVDLLTALSALQVVASPGATDAERERALALAKECGERWGMAEEVER